MAKRAADSAKSFRRGEAIYKEGENAGQIYLLQSGLVSCRVLQAGRPKEISQIVAPQLVGEEALWGSEKWSCTAVAANDVEATELKIEIARELILKSSPVIKTFVMSLVSKLEKNVTAISRLKIGEDTTPCGKDKVLKLFSTIYSVAKYLGEQKNGYTRLPWLAFRRYALRIFLESPVRFENAIFLLVKLGYAHLEMTKPEIEDKKAKIENGKESIEIGFVHFENLEPLREFYEFYRDHHFDGKISASPTNRGFLAEINLWNAEGAVKLPSEKFTLVPPKKRAA